MNNSKVKNEKRIRRHGRIRAKIKGTVDIPRLSVFKSNTALYAQLVDDDKGLVLASSSTMKAKGKDTAEKIKKMADEIAKKAGEQKIEKIVFDRGGYLYLGKVRALAEALREAGLKF